MTEFDMKPVAKFIRQADTEDLLDRVTIYRADMEPAAVDLMENELWRRGIQPEEVELHKQARLESVVTTQDGRTIRCLYCDRPAVSRRWGMYRLWGRLPLVPWVLSLCTEHGPPPTDTDPAY
jgi:hypothetical protein